MAFFFRKFDGNLFGRFNTMNKYFSYDCVKCCPLKGIRVCDMTNMVSGPYCTMVLGDMGAEVIKVEDTDTGDDSRSLGSSYVDEESCFYLSLNRNKKSISVDLKRPEGKEIIYELVKTCDVFIENSIPGHVSDLGFGYDKLSLINPALVYCSISGYGTSGPNHNMAADSVISSAVSGFMSITGHENGEECVVGAPITDIITGLYVTGAINSALYERKSSKRGTKIETSLLQSQMAYMSHIAGAYLNADIVGKRYGTAHSSIVPYQGFNTEDGMIVLAVGNNQQFTKTCKVLDLEDLLHDERFKTNEARTENRDALLDIISRKLVTQKSSHWLRLLDEIDVPSGSINSMQEVFSMPQIKDLDLIQEIQHPSLGSFKVTGPAIDFNGSSVLSTPRHPPLLGEHTKAILTDILNFTDEKVNYLLQKNIVKIAVS